MKVKNLNEAYESPNVDQPSFVDDELDRFYGPIRKMINDGDYEAAEKELDELTADLDEFEAQNNKKRFFKYPQFMIDGQRKNIEALRAKLPAKVAVGESVNDMDKRCEKCNTLLNDSGTCPKCDDGEEDYGDERLQLDESIFDDSKLILDEEALNEGPLGPALRKFGRTVANKFAPKGAEDREIKGHEKDDEAQHKKHSHPILARDFTTKAQKWRFIANKKGAKPVNFDQWWDEYKAVVSSNNPDSTKYAEWYNACVIDEDGFYIRRGSENLKGKLIKYIPGDNDELLRMWRVEPYEWYTHDPDPKEPDPDPKDPDPKDPDPDPKDPDPKDPKDPKPKPKPKKKTPVGAPELDRFRKLCKLTSFRVYDKASKKELTFDDICKITPETIPNYFVNTQYGRKSSLDVWFQAAIKSRFLYKLPEYIERFYKPTLNEATTLNESPKIQLDGVDLMNPESVNFRELIKRAADKEKAELAAKAAEESKEKYRSKYKTFAELASQYQDNPDEAIDVLFNILVPSEGKADTVAGELIRATMRLLYRSYNDGDVFYKGYGLETCAPSAMYLYNNGFDELIDSVIEKAADHDFSDDEYDAMLKDLTKQVIDYIVENPDCIYTENTIDSRDSNPEYIVDQQPTYDFEFYGSEDIVELVDAQLLNSWTLKEYVEQQLDYNTVTQGYETDRPWSHYDHQVTVSGLTSDAIDFIKNDLFRDVDSFWQDLVDEYSDELEELRREYDDDYEEEDDEEELDEGMSQEETSEFFRLAREIGVETGSDATRFAKDIKQPGETLLDALRRYRAELGDDFVVDDEYTGDMN